MQKITGKVIAIESLDPFHTKNGELFQKQVIIQYDEEFANKIVTKTVPFIRKGMNEPPKVYCIEGQEVEISYTIDSRQSESGRWYVNLIAHRITPL